MTTAVLPAGATGKTAETATRIPGVSELMGAFLRDPEGYVRSLERAEIAAEMVSRGKRVCRRLVTEDERDELAERVRAAEMQTRRALGQFEETVKRVSETIEQLARGR